MPRLSWLSFAALCTVGLLLLVVLLVGLVMALRAAKKRHKPLREIDLPQSHDSVDPWTESGERHRLDG